MGWDIVAIGTNHNLPVEDPIKTAERISTLVDGPISVGYYESWIFSPENNRIQQSQEYKWVEIAKINSQREGPTTEFAIEDYCARKIYSDLQGIIEDKFFVSKEKRDWFVREATDVPFALYECESQTRPFFDLRILKEIVEFTVDFPGRWSQFVETLKNPLVQPKKDQIFDFRRYIFRQLKACGCNQAYYFADQGSGGLLYDAINKPAKEWVDYLERGGFVDDEKLIIVEVEKLLDETLTLSEKDSIDCFIDNFSDF